MLSSKGQAAYIEPLFAVLAMSILALTLAGVVPGQATKISPELEANEFEARAIILADSIFANPDLTYFDDNTYHRGVFDSAKLDETLYKKGSLTSLYSCVPSTDNCKISTYPNSYALIVISDIENGKGWFTGTNKLSTSEASMNIVRCFQSKHEMGDAGTGELFKSNSDLSSVLNLEKCNLRRYSNILNSGFPVAIRYPDRIHAGILKVLVVE